MSFMETLWFILISILLIGYVVLDGFDLGVGTIYLWVAKTEAERDQIRSSIGPVWDGNEVWLIAAGGTLFFAFPKAYAAAFSSFYLALFLILWLLLLRGLAIELRSQLDNSLWHTFWDTLFSFASAALIFSLGVALGNLLRGIPFLMNGESALPFWTNFIPGPDAGLIDWYTLLVGGLAFVTLIIHGAAYLAIKTAGDIQVKAGRLVSRGVFILVPLIIVTLGVTPWVQPAAIEHFSSQPWGMVFPISVIVALASLFYFTKQGSANKVFMASSALIITLLATAVFGLYPHLLLNITNPANSLTVYNSATGGYGLRIGLIWFSLGFVLMLAYVAVMYRSFWGKVATDHSSSEY
jgi:cytochrome d ubiquinol oxidase subunit II